MSEVPAPAGLPVLPMKTSLLFPFVVMPIAAGRPGSMAAVEAALASEDKLLAVVAQRSPDVDHPTPSDLYTVGTRGIVRRMVREEGSMKLLVQGIERIVIERFVTTEPALTAEVRILPLPTDRSPEADALHRELIGVARTMQELADVPAASGLAEALERIEDPLHFAFVFASLLGLSLDKEQALLESETCLQALKMLHEHATYELQVLQLRKEISSQAQSEMSREQREYHLRHQLREIREELGEEGDADLSELEEKLKQAELPEHVREETQRELSRLGSMSPNSPDYQLTRTYLELVAELPWSKLTEDHLDLTVARTVLDEDHFGLKEVKERILEHLAVLKLNPEAKAPILCFVGPPGVGKTSLGKSIARSMGRKFERLSLGGLHDESELRGHRRTYIGAMPGRIIQAIRRAGVRNPVLMLDEVDKLGRDFRGDPAAALLEILDPAQNHDFHDNYLDLAFDLSRVFFIATANSLDPIPGPLLDRMEILRLSGYSEEEKVEIARRYLIDRQRAESGLKPEQLSFPEETLKAILRGYTREAGLRQFERALGRLARRAALKFAEGRTEPVVVGPDDLTEDLGPPKALLERSRKDLPPGVATGLAWTETGGDVLYVEALLIPDGNDLMLTGQLGAVMQESARAAHSYVLAHAATLGFEPKKGRIHLHVPAGAVPKDGPSAGVTMATAIASLYSGRPVRHDTAMTGEISLTGLVMPVGGIREKVLAAHRLGLKRIILPQENKVDLDELPDSVRASLEFVLAERIEDVLQSALQGLTAA